MPHDISALSTGDEKHDPLKEHLAEALKDEVTLVRRIGHGRTSVVYLAEEPELGRRVALKVLRPSYTSDKKAVERFKREARAMAGCPHPSIVPVHKVGQTDAGVPFFTMEFIEGETLEARLQRKGKLPLQEAARVINCIAAALTRAHELGLVHRDVKPADILMESGTGRILITDFGLAKLVARRNRLSTLTGTGEVLGTPKYTSPEQAETGIVTARSDQYSLAIVAYEMLSGRLPFSGPSSHDFLKQHVEDTPPFLMQLEPELPAEVARVIDRGMMKEPGARYSSADAFAEALQGAVRTTSHLPQEGPGFNWWRCQRLLIQGFAIYAGVAWGVLEALTWVLETFEISADLRRPALWVVLALLPLVMVLIFVYARSHDVRRREA